MEALSLASIPAKEKDGASFLLETLPCPVREIACILVTRAQHLMSKTSVHA